MRSLFGFLIVSVLAIAAFQSVRAQAPFGGDTKRLSFEVAAIKVNQSGRVGGSMAFQPGGRFRAVNLTAVNLVQTAFRANPELLSNQILGLPEWASSMRYDVTAKVPADASTDPAALYGDVYLYVRSLLEDRFALKAHMEKREQPIYALTMAPGGAKMRRSTLDCDAPQDRPKCGIAFNPDRLTGHSLEVAGLIGSLTRATGRVVLDRTNLDGKFDIDLQWKLEASTADALDDRASIFVAVQEQLGLKLESMRAPIDVLVVDHIERPAEN